MPKDTAASLDPTEEAIRMRAYELYEQRGCEPGHELDDWLQAEAEIMGKKRRAPKGDRTEVHRLVAA